MRRGSRESQGPIMAEHENPRLRVFSAQEIKKCQKKLGLSDAAPWPEIGGCLTALAPARSGGTLLCRQMETLFDIGQMGERFGPPKLKKLSAQAIVSEQLAAQAIDLERMKPWFAFKGGTSALGRLELIGFFDAYIDRTVFVRLIRRDIVAQAVSQAKAGQTGQWHVNNKAKSPVSPIYDLGMIAAGVKGIALQVERMRRYVESAGRPHTRLFYEDIAANGLCAAKAAGDVLGLPPREVGDDCELLRPIEKQGDEVNDEWRERFLKEMTAAVGGIIEDYVTAIDLGTTPRWAASGRGSAKRSLSKASGIGAGLKRSLKIKRADDGVTAETAVPRERTE